MIPEDIKLDLAGLWVLKKMDVSPEDGGMDFPVVLPVSWSPLETVLERMAVQGLVEIDRKKGKYELAQPGLDLLSNAIDEAEAFIEEFDDEEAEDVVRELKRRNLDPLRVRFLWGWYQGEIDDLVLFQQRRGTAEVERDWALYLVDDSFYAELAKDLS